MLAATLAVATGCAGAGVPGGVPGRPGGGGGSSVDPGACGSYAEIDIGRRVHAFLDATVRVQKAVFSVEVEVKNACVDMGRILGVDAEVFDGPTADVCNAVAASLRESLQAGLSGRAKLDISYEPAVCTVKADVAARAAAKCEGRASADVSATCSGTCEGTCNGACSGTCAATNASGDCAGACDGTCRGECSGSCTGTAEVDAEATCKAAAEVHANAEVVCTKPQLTIDYDASLVVDEARLDAAVKAIKTGLPRLIAAHAKLTGPGKKAVKIWARSAKRLAGSGAAKFKALGTEAMCVAGQLTAAAGAVAEVNASVSVSVEASASVGGSAGAGM